MQAHHHAFKAMGGPCSVHLYSPSADAAEAAGEAAQQEVLRLEHKYSRYRDDSVTTQINRSAGDRGGVLVDDETAGLLDYAAIVQRESGGLFDPTSGILRRAWDFRSGCLPAQSEIDALLPCVGWRYVRWHRPRLVLPRAGMELDFGGYGKEYAADRAAEVLRAHGIRHGLVDLAGDIRVVGPHPDGSGWRVGIRDPRAPERAAATLVLREGAIASSGDYERYMIVDGRRYAHILDPRTGWPAQGLAGVSVVASHCLIAGTAATVAMLKGPRAFRWLDGLGLPSLRIEDSGRMTGALAPSVSNARAA